MPLLTVIRPGRRLRPMLALSTLLVAAATLLFVPRVALLLLLVTALVIVWDRLALERDLRRLAASVTDTETGGKLEVTDDAWGELCHTINRLRQQRRAEQRLQRLLPELPPIEDLLEAELPPEGVPCDIAALAIALPEGAARAAHLREAATIAAASARQYHALLTRCGPHLLLIFGVTGQQSPTLILRNARQAARAVHTHWKLDAARRPRLVLAGGQARLVTLPGLGLSVIGPPVDQALDLLDLADEELLLCNEEAYLSLRRLGLVPAQLAGQRPIASKGYPGAYGIPL
ncbi:MAG: hypothetical protein SNJ69_13200 [Chloroflexaceae bacterium]